jgi:hypothetical protein
MVTLLLPFEFDSAACGSTGEPSGEVIYLLRQPGSRTFCLNRAGLTEEVLEMRERHKGFCFDVHKDSC